MMRVELRNGDVVDVPDPRDTHSAHEREAARHGRWVPELVNGEIVAMRWYPPEATT